MGHKPSVLGESPVFDPSIHSDQPHTWILSLFILFVLCYHHVAFYWYHLHTHVSVMHNVTKTWYPVEDRRSVNGLFYF